MADEASAYNNSAKRFKANTETIGSLYKLKKVKLINFIFDILKC